MGWWDKETLRLVELSTVAFIFLLLPQLWKNAEALASGNAAALAGLAWEVCPAFLPAGHCALCHLPLCRPCPLFDTSIHFGAATTAETACPKQSSPASSVQGFGTALMGNTQLLGYFIERHEPQAACIQGIGVVSNYAVLFQVCLLSCCHGPPLIHPLQPRSVYVLDLSEDTLLLSLQRERGACLLYTSPSPRD